MKYCSLFIAMILLSFGIYAQDAEKTLASFQIGPSIALNDFADDDVDSENAGFATNGFAMDLGIKYDIYKHIGLAVKGIYVTNPSDVSNVENDVEGLIGDLFGGGIGGGLFSPTIDISASPWKSIGVMVGPTYTYYTNRFEFDVRILAGLGFTSSPEVDFKASILIQQIEFTQQSENASSFAWSGGLGARYKIYQGFGFSMEVDYYTTNPEFEIEPNDEFGIIQAETVEQTIEMINITFGIGYRF